MSGPSNHPPDFLLQTFLVLQAIFRRHDNPQIQLKADHLYLDGKELIAPGVELSEAQLTDRIRELARRLELFSVSPQALAQIWSAELAKRTLSARELIGRGQVAAFKRKPHEIDLVKRWRDEFMPCLVHHLPSLNAVERFDESATQHDRQNKFDLGPILEDWPRRILEDPYWKYAEAPLPEMEPLALDDVWVDLCLSDPLESLEEERLGEYLELRDERQRWVTEPAAFVLERVYGATAIIGPPGCGKTTLLKWFSRQMISNPHGRFLLPLFVPLRKYARTRAGDRPSSGTLLEFALRQCGITHPAQLQMWMTTISYLTGSDRSRVLVMLDGWDEVPLEHRDLLLKEIDELAYSFSILITSRPSGFPRMLPVSHFYEIASLSHDNSERLIRRWFAAIGSPDQAEPVLRRLDDQPDLRRLARNPFLLSLLCSCSRWWTEDSAVSRTSLYRQAINLIVAHHNRHHPRTITSVEQRKVERLALWLQADVPNAPRYVFDRADAQACLNETATLETVLPSRLLSQLRLDQESFHFLHTTFQEYLAARGLLAESPAMLQQRMHNRSYDLSWQEILCFAAGEADDEKIRQVFWQRLVEMAQQPDRFGLIFARLARFIIEVGVEDGGKALLGVDVREKLWQAINRGIEIGTFVTAYVELDPLGLLSRIEARLSGPCEESMKARLLRVRGRIRGSESSQALINTLMHGDDYEAAIASYSGSSVLNVAGFNTLRAAVSDENLSPQQRVRAMRTLAGSKSSGVVAALKQLAARDSIAAELLVDEAIVALGRIGDSSASSALAELLSESDDPTRQATLITALTFANDPIARDHLIQEIVLRLPDDPLVPMALDGLVGKPFFEGTETIAELLKCEDPRVRAAAAKAIGFSARTVFGDRLVHIALDDRDRAVRLAALQSLAAQGNAQSIYQLAMIVNDAARDEDEQSRILATSVLIFERLHATHDAGLLAVLRRLMLTGLQTPHGVLALEAVTHSHILGTEILGRLVEICHDDEASDTIREEACWALARILRYRDHALKTRAESGLLALLRREPNAPPDDEQPNLDTRMRLAQAAADALTEINPELLIEEPGTTSRNALAAFSVRTGSLVFENRIISAHGDALAAESEAAEKANQTSAGVDVMPKPKDTKIKILFLASSPTDLGRIGLDREYHEIDQKLRVGSARDSFVLIPRFAVRPQDLQEALLRDQPHLVHFCGHGSTTEEIMLMDESGVSHPVRKAALAGLFRILKDNIRVVVLNACYSKPQAEAISQIIDYTIGTNKTIGDKAAIEFASAFYQGLSFGRSIDEAFELGKNLIDLKSQSGSEALELLVREGVDPKESFLLQQQVMRRDYVDDLKAAFNHLASGAATEGEAQGIRQAVIDGKIILQPDEIPAHNTRGAPGDLRVTTHRSFINVETDTKTFQDVQERLYPSPPGISPPLTRLVFVGRSEALHDVKDLLGIKRTTLPENRQTVIRGWPGVGKTSLVGVLSRDQEVQKAFPDGVLWASLYFGEEELSQSEQENKLLSLMASWGRALGTDTVLRAPTLNEATTQLAGLLSQKRMLLVVDDVWKQGHAVPFMQASGSECAVLVTTRLTQVANSLTAGGRKAYTLPVLTEEHAFRLLRILAEDVVDQHPDECRELVRDLECLPLALHVAAGQLKAEAKLGLDVGDLIKGIRDGAGILSENAPLDRSENGSTPTLNALLRRSTNGLDPSTQECFAFLGAFAPKPATFDLAAMAAVWQVSDPKPIVRILAGHGLLEPVGKGRFQMHALLVQHARSLLTD